MFINLKADHLVAFIVVVSALVVAVVGRTGNMHVKLLKSHEAAQSGDLAVGWFSSVRWFCVVCSFVLPSG